MSCTNCFNGCAETISDQCVRYTGEDVSALGISHGDSLLAVENAITTFLVPVLTGVGIKPIVNESVICNVVKQFLPTCTQCTGFTLNEVLTAIIKAACLLQEQIDDLVAEFETLNANYDVACLDDVTASSGTHDILQAAIDKICELEVNLGALVLDLATNYYTKTQVNTLLSNYTPPGGNLIKSKMIPYVAVPYFGPVSYFDANGAGIGDWIDIYLCVGTGSHPQAPDIRGRVLVGATTGVQGGPMNPAVIPNMGTGGFNPSYTVGSTYGANGVALSNINQIPSHTHTNTAVTSILDTHKHNFSDSREQGSGLMRGSAGIAGNGSPSITPSQDFTAGAGSGLGIIYYTSTTSAGAITASTTVTIDPTGNVTPEPHTNIQPVIACNYIIYIP
jgi:microcystin-dependent protein